MIHGDGARRAATVVLALSWLASAPLTCIALLLALQPFYLPECSSFDPAGARAARFVSAAIVLALLGVWPLAAFVLRRRGGTLVMLALAAAVPVALVVVFFAGATVMDLAIDAVAENTDHAMCF